MLSHVLNRYYEPLRLPSWPSAISFPYTLQLMTLYPHHEGSPALVCLSSATCRPCYPGRSSRPFPLYLSECVGLPLTSTGSASSILYDEATSGFTCVTACGFAIGKLTTPDYSDAASLCYRGVRTIPRAGL